MKRRVCECFLFFVHFFIFTIFFENSMIKYHCMFKIKGGIPVSKKSKTTLSRKEKAENLMQKWAFGILFALVIELLVYVFVLNLVPTMISRKNVTDQEELTSLQYNKDLIVSQEDNVTKAAVLNPFYQTDRYYTSNGNFLSTVDNPTWLIYDYNMVLLIASILLILYYLINKMENTPKGLGKSIKEFLKREWPFTILLTFICWVFISSCLAYDSYRSFIGCYNLKDGFFSFLMYGSILTTCLFIKKDNIRYRNIIINTFLITASFLAVITLWNYFYLTSEKSEPSIYYYARSSSSGVSGSYLVTYGKDTSKTAFTIGELLFGNGGIPRGKNFLIVTKRVLGEEHSGVFHNSNHYGYYLSICVIVAAVMAMKAKENWKRLLYLLSYATMLFMAIINNTFGAYLGIGVSLLFMFIYVLIPKMKIEGEDSHKSYLTELVVCLCMIAIFADLSCFTVNQSGKNIVGENFASISSDLGLLFGNQNLTNQENDGANESANSNSSSSSEVREIGSGRGKLWVKGLELATQKPFFGYGLENIIYEYNSQFNISEGRSHNLIVQLSATTGIVGMLLYVVGIASLWIRRLKYIKSWDLYECLGMFVIVSYIISSLVGNSGFATSPYFYIFVGFVILSRKEKTI